MLNPVDRKVAIVTGSNTGIGFGLATELAKKNIFVIMACRSTQKGELAAKQIGSNVIVRQLDLCSFKSIKSFVTDFTASFQQLDLLINNAGILSSKVF